MELIKPQSIASEIMNLMDDAKEFMIIVSPYNKVSNWGKLHKSIEKLKRNKIRVEYYIRADNDESYREVKAIGFVPMPVPNLHTKLYVNERQAIVTSMNLHESSDNHSLDIGYRTQNKQEYDELTNYYKQYIQEYSIVLNNKPEVTHNNSRSISNNPKPNKLEFFRHLERELSRSLTMYPVSREKDNVYRIGSRALEVFFQKGKIHQYVNIECILTGVLFDFFKPNETLLQRDTKSNVTFSPSTKDEYSYYHYSFRTPDKEPMDLNDEEICSLVDSIVDVQVKILALAQRLGNQKVNDNIHYQR